MENESPPQGHSVKMRGKWKPTPRTQCKNAWKMKAHPKDSDLFGRFAAEGYQGAKRRVQGYRVKMHGK
jgi:hypothetical protein